MKYILNREEVKTVCDILDRMYPEAKAELNFSNPFELLIATILSAQCTDKRVNMVTDELFKKFKYPKDYVDAGQSIIADNIKTCGLYKSKSKHIYDTCVSLIKDFDSKVPETLDELIKLKGVGRKTANVVVSNCFGVPAIAVDTHVFRVSNRIGLAHSDSVEKTEEQLMKRIDRTRWTKMHHNIIFHGRRICSSRNPKCDICDLNSICLYKLREVHKK